MLRAACLRPHADLFLQGVLAPAGGLPDFLAGSARSLSVPGQPIPFAVGKMALSKAEAVREGMKGRGWTLLHAYGDLLWQMGDKALPNEGFTASRILPVVPVEGEAAAEGGAAAAAAADGEQGAAAAAADQLGGLQLAEGSSAAAAQGRDAAAAAPLWTWMPFWRLLCWQGCTPSRAQTCQSKRATSTQST